jgi:hypothetical protein
MVFSPPWRAGAKLEILAKLKFRPLSPTTKYPGHPANIAFTLLVTDAGPGHFDVFGTSADCR